MPTFGYSAPNSVTQNLDTVLTLAFANAGNTIFDAISKSLAVFSEIKKNGMYEGIDAPEPYIEVPLLYALGEMEWYEGWDTLKTTPTEGITAALYPWRQAAIPVGYNNREKRTTNPNKVKDIVKVKIQQAQMGFADGWVKAFLQGNLPNGGNLYDCASSPTTGRSGIEPLPKLIFYHASETRPSSTSLEVGGINQNARAWWRNWSKASAASTYMAMLLEWDEMYDNCSKGAGGSPNLILTDFKTRSLLNAAYYQAFRRNLASDADYPFDNLKFRGARVVCDEQIPDVASVATDCTTKGTAYFINTNMLKIKYDTAANFSLGEFQKPVNQDGKVTHALWMGNVCMMNRIKHGVIGNIARTLTVS